MSSINKVILIGNVGKDPEFRSMNNGKEVANFSIATSQRWKDKSTGEQREKSEWHNICVFNEMLVSVIKNYVKKGSKLYVEGALQTRKWQDKTGADRYSTEVVLQGFSGTIVLLDKRDDNYASRQPLVQNTLPKTDVVEELDDNIPF